TPPSNPTTPTTPPTQTSGGSSTPSSSNSQPSSSSPPSSSSTPNQPTNPSPNSTSSSNSNTPPPTPTPTPIVPSTSSSTLVVTGPGGTRSTVTTFLTLPSSTPISPARENTKQSGFFGNTGAVAGVFAVVGVVALILAFFIITTCVRRRRARRFDREVAEAAAAAANTTLNPYEDDEDGGLGRLGPYIAGGGAGAGATAAGYDTPHRDPSKSSGHGSLRGDPVGYADSYNMSELAGSGVAGVGAGLAAGAGYGAYRGAGGHPQYQPQSAYNQQQQPPVPQGDVPNSYYDYPRNYPTPDGGYGAALYARSPPPGTQPYPGYLQQHPQGGFVYEPSPQPQGQQTQGLQRQPTYPGLAHSPAPSGTTAVSDPYAAVVAATSTASPTTTSAGVNPTGSLNRRSPNLPNPYDGTTSTQAAQNVNPAVDAHGGYGYVNNAYGGQQGFGAFGGQTQNPSFQQQPSQGQFQPYNDNAPLTTAFGAGNSLAHPDDDQEHIIAYDNSGHDHSAEDDNGSIAEDYGSRRVLKVRPCTFELSKADAMTLLLKVANE
ncbi:hypothetical protein Clacol_010277, partial [Clathrus columnatus]